MPRLVFAGEDDKGASPRFVFGSENDEGASGNGKTVPSPPGFVPGARVERPAEAPPILHVDLRGSASVEDYHSSHDSERGKGAKPVNGQARHVAQRRFDTDPLRRELAHIRTDLNNHNGRIIRMISQRLDDFSSGHERPPESLRVASPNGPTPPVGTYQLVKDNMPNGLPLWKQAGGPHWLYAMKNGKWGIGGQEEMDLEFKADGAFIFCPQDHQGAMPHMMQSMWKRNNPPWTGDPAILVQAVDFPAVPAPAACFDENIAAADPSECRGRRTRHRRRSSVQSQVTIAPQLHKVADGFVGEGEPVDLKNTVVRLGLTSSTGVEPMGRGSSAVRHYSSQRSGRVTRAQAATGSRGSAVLAMESATGSRGSAVMAMEATGSLPVAGAIGPLGTPLGRTRRSTMFPDTEKQKKNLRDNLLRGQYRVEDMYHKSGWCQCIARHDLFEIISLCVVMANALWMGIDADKNPEDLLPDAPIIFQLVEAFFCLYFCVEMSIRFTAFERKGDAFLDLSFFTDILLVVMMVVEFSFLYLLHWIGTSVTFFSGGGVSLVRVLRLSRLARLVRLLRAVPELMMLIKGIRAASSSVAWTSAFLMIIVYVFAVAFRILCKENALGKDRFADVPMSMSTFLKEGLLPDFAPLITRCGEEHIAYAFLFIIFLLVGTITVMNMLTGMLVHVVSSIADIEKENSHLAWVKLEIEKVMEDMAMLKDGTLSREEVELLLCEPAACRAIAEVGVDVMQLVEVAEFHIFNDRDCVSFRELLDLVLQLRQNKTVCLRDVVRLQQFMSDEVMAMEDRLLAVLKPVPEGGRNTRKTLSG